jgi:hypothetical protein
MQARRRRRPRARGCGRESLRASCLPFQEAQDALAGSMGANVRMNNTKRPTPPLWALTPGARSTILSSG